MLVNDVPVRVLVADDHPVVRQGLEAVFASEPDIDLIGDVMNIADLLLHLNTEQPDVLVLDLDLEPHSHDERSALRAVREQFQQLRIVVYTAHDEEERVVEALALGVEGYVLKSANPQELLKAVRVISRGGMLLQSSIGSTLMRHMRLHGSDEASRKTDLPVSRREMEVLELLGEGLSNQQIARRLAISERTVKFHVSSILNKLGAENRTSAVLKATRNGILGSTD